MVVSEATHFGGGRKLTLTAEYFLACRNERCANLDPTAAEFPVRLSKATRHRKGGPVHVIANVSATDDLPVRDRSGNALTTIAPGKVREFYLLDASTVAGVWLVGDEYTFVAGAAL